MYIINYYLYPCHHAFTTYNSQLRFFLIHIQFCIFQSVELHIPFYGDLCIQFHLYPIVRFWVFGSRFYPKQVLKCDHFIISMDQDENTKYVHFIHSIHPITELTMHRNSNYFTRYKSSSHYNINSNTSNIYITNLILSWKRHYTLQYILQQI